MVPGLALRPVFHYTEKRVRGHVAICVLAAVLEAVMSIDLKARKLTDPDLEGQHLTARRGLRELERIRMVRFSERRPTTSGRDPAEPLPGRDPRRPRCRHLRLTLTRRLITAITRCGAKTALARFRDQDLHV